VKQSEQPMTFRMMTALGGALNTQLANQRQTPISLRIAFIAA